MRRLATSLRVLYDIEFSMAFRLKAALESWDCSMNAFSSGASIYEVWLQLLLQDVFKANNWTEEALFSLVGA